MPPCPRRSSKAAAFFYCVREGKYEGKDNHGIANFIEVVRIDDSELTDADARWEHVLLIGQQDTGFPFNHNAGFLRDSGGQCFDPPGGANSRLDVLFSVSKPEAGMEKEWSYRIWRVEDVLNLKMWLSSIPFAPGDRVQATTDSGSGHYCQIWTGTVFDAGAQGLQPKYATGVLVRWDQRSPRSELHFVKAEKLRPFFDLPPKYGIPAGGISAGERHFTWAAATGGVPSGELCIVSLDLDAFEWVTKHETPSHFSTDLSDEEEWAVPFNFPPVFEQLVRDPAQFKGKTLRELGFRPHVNYMGGTATK